MSKGLFPDTNAGVLAFMNNMSTILTASGTSYGITMAQSSALANLTGILATSLPLAQNPSTKTKTTVAAKQQALVNVKAYAKLLISVIEGQSTVSNAMKVSLGLKLKSIPTPVPAPGAAPALEVISVVGWTVKIKLHDTNPSSKRGRPPGTAGANVFSFVGTTPPADVSAWKFEGSASKTVMDVVFNPTIAPGTRVFLCARWFNPRSQSGPLCSPVATNLQGGAVMAA